jgi:hypothetical protein
MRANPRFGPMFKSEFEQFGNGKFTVCRVYDNGKDGKNGHREAGVDGKTTASMRKRKRQWAMSNARLANEPNMISAAPFDRLSGHRKGEIQPSR